MSPDVDVDTVLDIAKDAAHQVQRPAAPVTTYLVGLAVASGMTVEEAADKVHELAQSWPGELTPMPDVSWHEARRIARAAAAALPAQLGSVG